MFTFTIKVGKRLETVQRKLSPKYTIPSSVGQKDAAEAGQRWRVGEF